MQSHSSRLQWSTAALLWWLSAILAVSGSSGALQAADSSTGRVAGPHAELLPKPVHEVHEKPLLPHVTSRRLQQGSNTLDVVAWGSLSFATASVPDSVRGWHVQYMAAGWRNAAVIINDTLTVWGDNTFGLNDISGTTGVSVVSLAAEDLIYLLKNGTVMAWPDSMQSLVPPAAKFNVKAISSGAYHHLALLNNGTVVAWNTSSIGNIYGEATVPAGLSNVTAVSAGLGGEQSLALLRNGSVVVWGRNDNGQISSQPAGLSDVAAIAAGQTQCLALRRNGMVVMWGNDTDNGQVPPAAQSSVAAIAAGHWWSMALLSNGTAVAWGYDAEGRTDLPIETQANVARIAAGPTFGLAYIDPSAHLQQSPVPPPPSALSPLLTSPVQPPAQAPLPSPQSPPPPRVLTLPVQPPPASPPLALPPLSLPGPPSSTQTPQDATSSSSPKVGVIVGGAIAGVAAVAAFALLGWWLVRRHKRNALPPALGNLPEPSEWSLPGVPRTLAFNTGALEPVTGTGSGKHVSVDRRTTASTTDAEPINDRAYQSKVLHKIKISWESITVGSVLGKGGFGSVRKGMWQGNTVAVKMLNLKTLNTRAQEELREEALAMCDLRHPCIAQVFGLVDDGINTALVMCFYKRGTVAAVVQDPAYCNLEMAQRLKMALQIASGMCFLHSQQLLHGDLKTSNLLVKDTGDGVVLADFGLSTVAGQTVTSGAMTVSISPPEVLENPTAPRTQAGDVYAFAIVLLEIFSGRAAYRSMKFAQIQECVCRGMRPTIPDDVPPGVAAIIAACWEQEAASRHTFVEVMRKLEAEAAAGALDDNTATQNMTTTRAAFTLTDLTASRF